MLTINECFLGHHFTCEKCPVCEPDELRVLRDERAYAEECELLMLMVEPLASSLAAAFARPDELGRTKPAPAPDEELVSGAA